MRMAPSTRAHEVGLVGFDTETTSLDPLQAELVGFSLAVAPNEACYAPLGHRTGAEDLFDGGGLVPDQIREEEGSPPRSKPPRSAGRLKIGHNVKFDLQTLAQRGATVAPIDDTMLISYALDAAATTMDNGMDTLSERFLGHKPIAFSEVAGSGRNFVGFARVAIDKGLH